MWSALTAAPDSVRRALENDRGLVSTNGPDPPVAAGSSADGGAPTASAVNEALRSHNHKALKAFISELHLETSAGIIRAIGEAFNGTMLLPARVLFNTAPLGDPTPSGMRPWRG